MLKRLLISQVINIISEKKARKAREKRLKNLKIERVEDDSLLKADRSVLSGASALLIQAVKRF